MDEYMTPDGTKIVLHEILDEKGISRELHHDHHQFIHEMISKRKRREALLQRARLSFVGSLAAALVGGLMWLGKWVIENIITSFHAP